MSLDARTERPPQHEPRYVINWDGEVVTLPLVLPSSGDDRRDGFISETTAATELASASSRSTKFGIQVDVSLVPRPDNDYNEWAVSIAVPPDGRSVQDRHMGFLYDDYLGRRGQKALHRLARYSDGEIRCTAYVARDGALRALALPAPDELLAAIDAYLAAPSTPASRTRPDLNDLLGLRPYGQALTAESLAHLSAFAKEAQAVGQIALSTQNNARGRPRSLRLYDELTGRHLGEVALGTLFLEDERDRHAVLARLAEMGVPVAQPVPLPADALSGSGWRAEQIPNMWTYWRVEGLDFRPRDPEHPRSQTWVAQYNPTTKMLFVEDEPLVPPSRIYAARLGLHVVEARVPNQRWQLEREVQYRERRDLDLRPEDYLDTTFKPKIWKILRHKVPAGMVTDDDVTWLAGVPSRNDHPAPQAAEFAMHEATVRARSSLFPEQQPTGRVVGCRLCGEPGTEFSTRGCEGPLSYCQTCLDHAYRGAFDSFDQAVIAVRFLSDHEYAGGALLENQIATVQLDPASPLSPVGVDGLLIARFAIKRRRWPWTRILAQAGLLGDGLRMARGTIMEAQDGHLCLSMQEKAVDDFLHHHDIPHDREPLYPQDPELNPKTLRRADWLLADGTLVEMWGLPDDPAYAAKMHEKQQLANRFGINLVGLTLADIPRLPAIFAPWLSGQSASTSAWTPPARKARKSGEVGDARGGNPRNRQQREERLARCHEAVEYQDAGFRRREIAEALDVAPETVKILLRDGKFYANPESDPARSDAALAAAEAREIGQTKQQFRDSQGLTAPKASEAWKDADVLFPANPS